MGVGTPLKISLSPPPRLQLPGKGLDLKLLVRAEGARVDPECPTIHLSADGAPDVETVVTPDRAGTVLVTLFLTVRGEPIHKSTFVLPVEN